MKSDVHKLDIDKLEAAPADLSKVSDTVKSEVVKTIVYSKLAKCNSCYWY